MAARLVKFVYCIDCRKPTQVRLTDGDGRCPNCTLDALTKENRERRLRKANDN